MSQLEEIIKDFQIESLDLLSGMETDLLSLEAENFPQERINSLFRAVHTIKGTGGMLGFTDIVNFTHLVENYLDRLREGTETPNSETVNILLEVKDHLTTLLQLTTNQGKVTEELKEKGNAILKKIPDAAEEKKSLESAEESSTVEQKNLENSHYLIYLKNGKNLFQNALDPYPFFAYLKNLGTVVSFWTDTQFPNLDSFNPELNYLSFGIVFQSDASAKQVESVFDFLQYDSQIGILEPTTDAGKLVSLLQKLELDPILFLNKLVEIQYISPAEQIYCLEILRGVKGVSFTTDQPLKNLPKDTAKPNDLALSILKVESHKIDNLVGKVGELVVTSSNLFMLLGEKEDPTLSEASNNLSRLIGEIREISLKLRMVQIGDSFAKYNRTTRDLGRELGKKVKLYISGAETELDKTIVEKILDPLTHIIRNSIDHGIELPEERVRLGKPQEGNIYLDAYTETGSIVVSIRDDGKGLDKEKIRRKAIEKGLISEASELKESDIFKLIFHPGFSTKDEVSNISGRGVGMDVVLKNISSLRGSVHIESKENEGTTIKIRLPLTLAIIEGFLVSVNENLFVIPMETVMECVEWDESYITENRNHIHLRGNILPFIKMHELFQITKSNHDRENLVIVESNGKKAGLVVNKLYGQLQAVIKPSGKLFQKVSELSGSTTLGDGSVALILDIPNIINTVVANEDLIYS